MESTFQIEDELSQEADFKDGLSKSPQTSKRTLYGVEEHGKEEEKGRERKTVIQVWKERKAGSLGEE